MSGDYTASGIKCRLKKYRELRFNIGAAVPSMTVKILDEINVVLPSAEILLRFESVISPMFEKKRVLEKQIETASQARDRLLPKLMGGEIEV